MQRVVGFCYPQSRTHGKKTLPRVPALVRRANRGGWRQWGLESEAVYKEIVTGGPRQLADLMQALFAFLGRSDMMAYLVMMVVRLIELRGELKVRAHRAPAATTRRSMQVMRG